MVVFPPKAASSGARAPRRVRPYPQLVAYLDELVRRVGVGVSPDERGGQVRSSAVVAAAVGVEALEREVLLYPGGILEGVGLEKGHNVVLDGDVLAAAYGQMLEGVYARRKHAPDQGDARDGRVAEVQARQARAVGGYDLLQQGVERVGLGGALPAVGRLVARRAHGDGGLGQAERERLPCQRVLAQEGAQVAGGVVEVEEGDGGHLGQQRLQDGRVGRDDRLKQAEGRIVRLGLLPRPRGRRRSADEGVGAIPVAVAGTCVFRVPEEVRLALLLRAHAGQWRVWQLEALGQVRPYKAVLSNETAGKHAIETCRLQRRGRAVCSAGSSVGVVVRAGEATWSRVCLGGGGWLIATRRPPSPSPRLQARHKALACAVRFGLPSPAHVLDASPPPIAMQP